MVRCALAGAAAILAFTAVKTVRLAVGMMRLFGRRTEMPSLDAPRFVFLGLGLVLLKVPVVAAALEPFPCIVTRVAIRTDCWVKQDGRSRRNHRLANRIGEHSGAFQRNLGLAVQRNPEAYDAARHNLRFALAPNIP
jgi:hypothetical protein